VLLHASSGMAAAELSSALDMWRAARLITASASLGVVTALRRGGIVGYCRALGHLRPDGTAAVVVDGEPRTMSAAEVRRRFDLRWWSGGHGLLLTDVEQLPFVPCSGALNMWQVPAEVLQQLETAGRRFDRYGNLLYRTRVRGHERWVTIPRDERIAS